MSIKSLTYQDRNILLKEMGYPNYEAYLRSDLWRGIRVRAFREKGSICSLCGKPADLLHHRGYGRAVLEGSDLGPLVPICKGCHSAVELKKNGKKRPLCRVEGVYNALLKRYKRVKKGKTDVRKQRMKNGFYRVLCDTPGCNNSKKKYRQYCGSCQRKLREREQNSSG